MRCSDESPVWSTRTLSLLPQRLRQQLGVQVQCSITSWKGEREAVDLLLHSADQADERPQARSRHSRKLRQGTSHPPHVTETLSCSLQ